MVGAAFFFRFSMDWDGPAFSDSWAPTKIYIHNSKIPIDARRIVIHVSHKRQNGLSDIDMGN